MTNFWDNSFIKCDTYFRTDGVNDLSWKTNNYENKTQNEVKLKENTNEGKNAKRLIKVIFDFFFNLSFFFLSK